MLNIDPRPVNDKDSEYIRNIYNRGGKISCSHYSELAKKDYPSGTGLLFRLGRIAMTCFDCSSWVDRVAFKAASIIKPQGEQRRCEAHE